MVGVAVGVAVGGAFVFPVVVVVGVRVGVDMNAKLTPPARAEPKPPIYPVAVIEVACRALEAFAAITPITNTVTPEFHQKMDETVTKAIEIIHDGLASHEKAIKGEP